MKRKILLAYFTVLLAFLLPNSPKSSTPHAGSLQPKPIATIEPHTAPTPASFDLVGYVAAEPVKTEPEPVKQAQSGDIEQIVRDAAIKHGVDPDYLVHIAKCESGLNPNAINYNYYENGYPSGLFQHISGYYPARAEKYGYSTDVFDPYSNANVTAAMFADGLQHLWECK